MTRDRGQTMAVEIAKFFVALVLAALLLVMLQEPFQEVSNVTQNETTNQTALTGLQWSQIAWNNLPTFFLLAGAMGVIVTAVFLQRKV